MGRRILYVCLLIALTGAISILWPKISEANQSDGTWDWYGMEPRVWGKSELPVGFDPGYCPGNSMHSTIYASDEPIHSCVYNGALADLVYTSDGSRRGYFAARPGDKVLYPLNNSPCDLEDTCIYVPQRDLLVVKQHVINGLVRSLVIYKNFSSRLYAHLEQNKEDSYTYEKTGYDFKSDDPEYTFYSIDDNTYAWPVQAVAASENGRWLAVEFRARGIGLMDLDTFEMRRVSNEIMYYGRGIDPHVTLAVSNTGRNIAVMGFNAGFRLIDVTTGCGDEPTYERMLSIMPIAQPCTFPNIYPDMYVDDFITALKPRYFNDGSMLSFYASSRIGKIYEVLLAHQAFQTTGVRYIALGDSYTSGEGETDDGYYLAGTNNTFEKCHTSLRSYPYLLGGIYGMNPEELFSVACSGATTNDIVAENEKDYYGQGQRLKSVSFMENDWHIFKANATTDKIPGRVQQIDFLQRYQPELVTIGIGGNDIGLLDAVRSCVNLGTCEFAQPGTLRYSMAKKINGLYSRLLETIDGARIASPAATLRLVGYPDALGDPSRCSTLMRRLFSNEERMFVRETLTYLNETIRAAARKSGIQYLDISDAFGPHALCGSSKQKAVQEVVGGDEIALLGIDWLKVIGNETLHPTPFGHKLIANSIRDQTANIFMSSCPEGYIVCPDEDASAPPMDAYWTEGIEVSDAMPDVSTAVDVTKNKKGARTYTVNVQEGSLLPGSAARIEVHSDPVALGSYEATSGGGLNVELEIPNGVTVDIHTLHVYGVDAFGSEVDIFTPIAVYDEPSDSSEWSVGVNPETNSTEQILGGEDTHGAYYELRDVDADFSGERVVAVAENSLLPQEMDKQAGPDAAQVQVGFDALWITAGIASLSIGTLLLARRRRQVRGT